MRAAQAAKTKFVKKIGVHLNLDKQLDIYDLRSLLFGTLVATEKNLPLIGYLHCPGGQLEEKNRELLEQINLPFDKEINIRQEGLSTQIAEALKDLKERDRIRERSDGGIIFSFPSETVTMKDMRVGEFTLNLNEHITTPRFYIKKGDSFSPNFLFSVLPEKFEDLVLMENERDLLQSAYKLGILEARQLPTPRFLHLPLISSVGHY
jgi:hypothetical protein